MAHKQWLISDVNKEQASALSEKFSLDPFVSYLLAARGIDSEAAVSDFLSQSYTFASPMGFADMDKAVLCISHALDYGERICVYGDYDCDGVTSTALLVNFFESMGADVFCYIPDRESEGYGMSLKSVEYIANQGAKLIITVDNGISSIEEAKSVYEHDMKLIITDHHQLTDTLPMAEAVINPHRTDNNIPFKDFAGVGVAFKLACALCGDTDEVLTQYADLAAIGTVADMVPLKGENRCLVRAGLDAVNNSPRIGIQALKKAIEKQSGTDKVYGASDLAFRICPRINAAGRLTHADNALALLLCDDTDKADTVAYALCDENARRQELEQSILSDIKEQIKKDPSLIRGRVMVIAGRNYHPGVIGIAAAHLLELYGKPCIVINIADDGVACGSARSIEGFNINAAIGSCSDILIRFGGHVMAAGLTIAAENIDLFRRQINEYAYNTYDIMPHETLKIDCKLSPHYLSLDLVQALEVLEPCGADNPEAVFGLYGINIVSVSPMGQGRHIRIEAEKNGKRMRIAKFGTTIEEFPFVPGDKIDCAVTIGRNDFKGKTYLSVKAEDIRKNAIDEALYYRAMDDYDKLSAGKKPQLAVYPNRDDCALIYRFLRSRGGWHASVDDLYFALDQKLTMSQLKAAIEAFTQAGLIITDNGIQLCSTAEKKNLEETEVLIRLKERFC